jgi:chromatin remodeling complex protein RSC6
MRRKRGPPCHFQKRCEVKSLTGEESRRYTYERKSTGDNTAEVEDEGDPMDDDEELEDDESAGKKRRKIKASQKF